MGAFGKITVGMTKDDVIDLLGEPLSKDVAGSGVERGTYSRDGRFPLIDFAWLGRHLEFMSDRVSGVEARVYYD